jgi:ATP-binding cassette subfamily C protein
MRSLSFGYTGSASEIITDVSLEIKSGSQAALIGTSGAGKSTLADLMLGLLEPTKGSVLVDGVNPSVLISSRPGLMAYVPQKPGMISGTIAQNIALGFDSSEIDMTKLTKAVADAHLSQYVNSLPDGLDTDIGKRKDELSGGQLQRIGLARALYTEPKLLIMDEATSALDAESEHEINIALDVMRGKVTVVLIAHRLNTIQRSDLVFLVDEGKIAAQGTFKQLMNSNLKVKNLARLMEIQPKE